MSETQQPQPDEQPAPEEQEGSSGRYAVYDATLLRFVGKVHETRKAARDAAREAGKDPAVGKSESGRFKVREV